tara:strand:- start:1040 stop:1300 length:261 start_codon:yes stop_codon:yes gene_type:complete
MSREFSDLKLERKECPKCGAIWINGQHRWSGTGAKGNNLDLAGLVCNMMADTNCINPAKGREGGDTWEKRLAFLEQLENKHKGDLY